MCNPSYGLAWDKGHTQALSVAVIKTIFQLRAYFNEGAGVADGEKCLLKKSREWKA